MPDFWLEDREYYTWSAVAPLLRTLDQRNCLQLIMKMENSSQKAGALAVMLWMADLQPIKHHHLHLSRKSPTSMRTSWHFSS